MDVNLKRFDIVLVDFGDNIIDSEQGGIRPALIIQNDMGNLHSSTTIVMPLSSNTNKNPYLPTHAPLKKGKDKGLLRDSMILGECIRQISKRRIKKYLGCVSSEIEKKEIKRVYDANFGEVV